MNVRVVRADGIVLGEERPLRDAAVVLDADGTVLDVGPSSDILPRHAGVRVETVRGVLLPGLVNAHAHVELSALRGKVQGGAGFVPWVERMIGLRSAEQPEEDDGAIERAAAELDAFGTAAIGEVTNTLAAVPALVRRGIGGAIFHEVFGLDREQALARVAKLERDAASADSCLPAPDFAYALAPHTVYTTHPDAVRAVLGAARARGVRTTVHLAEHPAERVFLETGGGAFFDFAARMRFPVATFPVPRRGPIDAAADLGLLAPDVVLVHLTDARPDELDRVARSGAPVVLCPRSNLFIEVKLPPLAEMLRAGIVPALGTDSLASNLSLDVLAEARALGDRFPSVPKAALLTMATAAGARALGRTDLGRIAQGLRPGDRRRQRRARRGRRPVEFRAAKSARGARLHPKTSPRGASRARRTLPVTRFDRTRSAMIAQSIARARTFSSLVKLSHTIFALPFAAAAVALSTLRPHAPLSAGRALLMLAAMVTARTAAMAYNRFLDRDIDAENPRTRDREVPRGLVSPPAALALTIASSAAFVASAIELGRWPGLLAVPVLVVLLGYSWTKRFTWASHLVLGVALALAPGGAWIAMGADPAPAIFALMIAVMTWVAGFDVLYSLQDEGFDREHALHSIPARFGTLGAVVISALLHVVTLASLVLCGLWLGRGAAFFAGTALVGLLLVYEHALVGRGNLEKIDRAFFDINGYLSCAFFALTALDVWLST